MVGFYENRLKNGELSEQNGARQLFQTNHCQRNQLIGTVGFGVQMSKSWRQKKCRKSLGKYFLKTNNKSSFCSALVDKPIFELIFEKFGEEFAVKTELFSFNGRLIPKFHRYVGSYLKGAILIICKIK